MLDLRAIWLRLTILMCLGLTLYGVECASGEDPLMHIRLKDGSFGKGTIVPGTRPNVLSWKNDGFMDVLEFNSDAIRSVSRIVTAEDEQAAEKQTSAFEFELRDSYKLIGQLVAIDDDVVVVESELLGVVSILRDEIASIASADDGGQLIFGGINDDAVWQVAGEEKNWEFEAGSLVTSAAGATVCGNVSLPARSRIDLALAWSDAPEFMIMLGAAVSKKSPQAEPLESAAKLEVWDKQLVLVREVDGNADIAMLMDLTDEKNEIELTIYLDQESGTVSVAETHGPTLETLQLAGKNPVVRPAVTFTNLAQSLTISRFEVRKWEGGLVDASESSEPMVEDLAGEKITGVISGFNQSTRELVIQALAGQESKLPIDRLRRGSVGKLNHKSGTEDSKKEDKKANGDSVPESAAAMSSPLKDAAASPMKSTKKELHEPIPAAVSDDLIVNLIFMDRSRLRGKWRESGTDKLAVDVIGLRETLQFSSTALRGLYGPSRAFPLPDSEQKIGMLHIGESQFAGYLLANSPPESRTALHWHPLSSEKASEVNESANGVIEYSKYARRVTKSSTTQTNTARAIRQPQGGLMAPILNLFGPAKVEAAVKLDPVEPIPKVELFEIRFCSGDAIEGNVVHVDDRGMKFSSPQTETNFATHEQIDQVWLNKPHSSNKVDAEKLRRLMTVPRSMKNDPPTHLLVSTTGDYLRGRLIRLGEGVVSIEVRSDLMEIPAAQISQIIWLYHREWESEKKADEENVRPEPTPETGDPFLVHAVTSGDHGLTLRPQQIVDGVLKGHSDLLGESAVTLSDVRQLLFGHDIGQRVRVLRDESWTLSLATYPRVYREDATDSENASTGDISPLVGKPAPDFKLSSIDGNSFRLSDHRDRVVVLDFWASWCGPCIQTMPLVDEVVQEIGGDKVRLLAVNIQETEARARLAIERLEISCEVLLDHDGQTAAVYGANAIPQTVIVDRDGNVTHVFVGGGKKFVESFREALRSVVEAN